MGERDTSYSIHFEARVLKAWIRAGWLSPSDSPQTLDLSPTDRARAHLIRDLKENFGVNDEGVDLILDLVDQIYGLRRSLRHVLEAGPSKTRIVAVKGVRARRPARPGSKRPARHKSF